MPTDGSITSSKDRSWSQTAGLCVLALLVALGATSILSGIWARDYAEARTTLLGSDRGISLLVTAGPARVLIVNGTDSAALGNALSKARHPGLDRIDLMIVSGNAAAADLVPRAIELIDPREVMAVGSAASLVNTSIQPVKVITSATEIELPEGVTIAIDVWPAADGENEDVSWSATIERAGASLYWVSDRETLAQDSIPVEADVVVIGRGAPTDDTRFPQTGTIVVAGESISGPDLRAIASNALGPDVDAKRVFSGEAARVDLDPVGIDTVPGAVPAGSPEAVSLVTAPPAAAPAIDRTLP